MRAIVRSALLVCLVATFAVADAHDDVIEVFTSMAAALTAVDVPQFMAAFDKNMPEYGMLETDVNALVNQAEVSSSIQPLNEDGDNQDRKADLDWYLEVRSLQQDGPIVRRRQVIHCELRKEKKHWKIVSLKPLDFFAPAKLGQ
jgi:hypothetical protein